MVKKQKSSSNIKKEKKDTTVQNKNEPKQSNTNKQATKQKKNNKKKKVSQPAQQPKLSIKQSKSKIQKQPQVIQQNIESGQQNVQQDIKPTKNKKKNINKSKKQKTNKKSSKSQKVDNQKADKLQRGYKFCQNCKTILNIHKYVCTQCGYVHNMKKHKFDVMKNLSKATPKILKSIIQANQFNTIKIQNQNQNSLIYPVSYKLEQVKQNIQQLIGQKALNNKKSNDIELKISERQLKRVKSQRINQKLIMTRNKSSQSQKNKIQKDRIINNMQSKQNKQNNKLQKQQYKKIKFEQLNIIENITEQENNQQNNINKQDKQNKQIKSDKYRQQFSIYRSQYPITLLQELSVQQKISKQKNNNQQKTVNKYLLYCEQKQKKQIFNQQDYFINNWNHPHHNQGYSSNINQSIDQNQKRKIEQQRQKFKQSKKLNYLTQKALLLQKYHKIGSIYQGQTIINLMLLNNNQNQQNQISNVKNNINQSNQNQFYVHKIGIKQHVQNIKSINNKVALLTGKKQILLLNLHTFTSSQIFNSQLNTNLSTDNINWLQNQNFTSLNNVIVSQNNTNVLQNKYLSKISLFNSDLPSLQDDMFMVIQWLKLYTQYQNNHQNINLSYLATGTLYGHIIIYQITSQNQVSIFRTIVSAHFQIVNCIKQCPLNNNGTSIFASASYDGSVKIWQLQHKYPVCEFEVSNRKVQQIYWDSGAKYLLIIRDQGLQNCYIACFYSISNRIQLPIMLSDSIDYRLIRNGILFDNSCSPLISYALNSKLIVMLNSRNGYMKILQSEQLRKTSLKRKKSKKNHLYEVYHDYWIRLNNNEQLNNKNVQKSNKSIKHKDKAQIQIIDMKSNMNTSLFNKYGNEQDNKQKFNQQKNIQQNINKYIEQEQQQQVKHQRKVSNYKQKQVNKKQIPKSNKQQVQKVNNPQPVGLRKSLRARKPNIQYNYMQEQQVQDSIEKIKQRNKKNNNKKNKKQSDEQQFYDEDQIQKQSQQEEQQESDQFQVKNKSKSKNKQSNLNVKSNKNKYQPNKGNSSKGNQKSNIGNNKGINKNNKQTNNKINKQSNEINKNQQTNSQQQALCKLFWQQTHQQSLVNLKSYPYNKFPKFSSIISILQKTNESHHINKQTQNMKQRQRKNKKMEEQNQSQNNQSNNCHQSINQSQSQYLLTFIAGYNGQLIKIKIKVQDQQKNQQNQQS